MTAQKVSLAFWLKHRDLPAGHRRAWLGKPGTREEIADEAEGTLIALVLLGWFGGAAVWVYKHPCQMMRRRRPMAATTKLLTIADDQFQESKSPGGPAKLSS